MVHENIYEKLLINTKKSKDMFMYKVNWYTFLCNVFENNLETLETCIYKL